jgi:hypothetical protein
VAPSPAAPKVGPVSQFVGGRLVLIGLVAGVVGFVILGLVGFEVWRVATGAHLGKNLVALVVGGALATSLLSIGGSAWRTGLKYLHGERAVARDVGRFVVRRLEKRSRRRFG